MQPVTACSPDTCLYGGYLTICARLRGPRPAAILSLIQVWTLRGPALCGQLTRANLPMEQHRIYMVVAKATDKVRRAHRHLVAQRTEMQSGWQGCCRRGGAAGQHLTQHCVATWVVVILLVGLGAGAGLSAQV
jgi:hypothetical protein